ncbi:E3 ubiquitin-protein ligase TRIM38-like [Numida meleagris]|uniref:E3 ubiquitin-protein ligase TRIM38-like n=1 Tax=Numida meleagris TaxID=8996 RepID=UPI000B3E11E5|nr:E3 ubiquitin-protein ligase TRIM38-like [Numida meleagris]
MAAAIDFERLQAEVELSCSCCLNYFTDPTRITRCAHSFCWSCITKYSKGRQRALCPLCREGFELKDLRPNQEPAALVNLIPKEVKEEDLETWDEPTSSGDGACGSQSSAGQGPGEKEEQIRNISKQLEMTEEAVNILRRDLSETKEYTSQIKSRIAKDFCCMKEYIERREKYTGVH